MTAEMIREKVAAIPDENVEYAREPSTRVTGPLATPEELEKLAEYVAVVGKELGPVPDEIREQIYADLASADAKISRIR